MLQAATGFGFSLVAAPLLFAAIGPEPAVVALLALGVEVNLLTLATEGRRPRPLWRATAVMLAWSVPGRSPASRCSARSPGRPAGGRDARRGRHARRAAGAARARARVGGRARGGRAEHNHVDQRPAAAAASARARRDARAGARHAHGVLPRARPDRRGGPLSSPATRSSPTPRCWPRSSRRWRSRISSAGALFHGSRPAGATSPC